jgi:hypothetical protein
MAEQQSGFNFSYRAKAQSAFDTFASGAGAFGLYVRPSQGFRRTVAKAMSQVIRPDGMSLKPRHGSVGATAGFESEVGVDVMDEVAEAVLRSTWTAQATKTEADLTSCTISGTGVTLTFGASVLTAGLRVGMMAKFANMSVAGNNGKWFPVLAISSNGLVVTTITGILADNTIDSAFSLVIARNLSQGATPTERYFTHELYLQDVDRSLRIQNGKYSSLNLNFGPDAPATFGFDILGTDMDLQLAAASPIFSSPAFAESRPLYLADGGIYVNGTRYYNFTGGSMGMRLEGALQPVSGRRTSPGVFLKNMNLAGEVVSTMEDATFLDLVTAETQLSMLLHFAERETDPADFVSFFWGDLSFADFGAAVGQSAAMLQTLELIGGVDQRTTALGYAQSMCLVSTSATS